MSDRATLDQYIETLQILAHEGDADRTKADRERDAGYRAQLINAFAHELAEQQRAHANSVDGELGCWHDGASAVADLIDPQQSAGPVRPDEEQA